MAAAAAAVRQGLESLPEDMAYAPVTSLTPLAHYEKVVEAFGGKGYFVSKPAELLPTLKDAFAQKVMRSVVALWLDFDPCDRFVIARLGTTCQDTECRACLCLLGVD